MENIVVEIKRLLQTIFDIYGYDFRNYASASIERRVMRQLAVSKLSSVAQMTERVVNDRRFFEELAQGFSVSVTEMFRDPFFYKSLREEVIPFLKTWPFIRVWVAGCASGEEIYSLAIVFKEEGIYDRCQIYATDFNTNALKKAKEGIYSANLIKSYTQNYQQAGGKRSFSDYYIAHHGSVLMDASLREKVTFSTHNLVTDEVFNEMQLITCRNVMIYFNSELQNRVLNLFKSSLCRDGFLCLGTKETLNFSAVRSDFEEVMRREKIYQKKTV